jgi:branched-chain amino acid transport system substrate-binding protein
MNRRDMLAAGLVAALVSGLGSAASADGAPVKIGLILPMTGPFASTGRQIEAAARLYMQVNGANAGGRTIELIIRDDTDSPDVTKRVAQELIVKDKVGLLAGFGLTPLALAVAPLATQAKVPAIVMAAATSSITETSPFIVRSGFTLAQVAEPMAVWASQNGFRKVVTLVSDYGPGVEPKRPSSIRLK